MTSGYVCGCNCSVHCTPDEKSCLHEIWDVIKTDTKFHYKVIFDDWSKPAKMSVQDGHWNLVTATANYKAFLHSITDLSFGRVENSFADLSTDTTSQRD